MYNVLWFPGLSAGSVTTQSLEDGLSVTNHQGPGISPKKAVKLPEQVSNDMSSSPIYKWFFMLILVFMFVRLGFYAVSTVFQLFNGDSAQIRVSWTMFNQYLTSLLS